MRILKYKFFVVSLFCMHACMAMECYSCRIQAHRPYDTFSNKEKISYVCGFAADVGINSAVSYLLSTYFSKKALLCFDQDNNSYFDDCKKMTFFGACIAGLTIHSGWSIYRMVRFMRTSKKQTLRKGNL